jgi:hypothetical protein
MRNRPTTKQKMALTCLKLRREQRAREAAMSKDKHNEESRKAWLPYQSPAEDFGYGWLAFGVVCLMLVSLFVFA